LNKPDTSPAGIFSKKVEKAFLVTIYSKKEELRKAEELLQELKSLVKTMGLLPVDSRKVFLRSPHSRFLVGSGKAEEISEAAKEAEADCIIFDDELSPSQQRNLERLSGLCVIDRHEVILDIFADHARTKEAVLQVGLARMEYSLPRLTRAWTHLSRQRGGLRGTRGEGETQLETDRRIVLEKIHRFKEELEKVKTQRETRRKKRGLVPVPTASIVGYTNAGKSSLLNALTGADVLVENKLFATLDSTTRKIRVDGKKTLLITDTVGFIRKLPHDLVEAFSSTLEEALQSDVLIHLIDASHPEAQEHYTTTLAVLEELGADEVLRITVFNKTDQCDPEELGFLRIRYPDAHFISAKKGEGLDLLVANIKETLKERNRTVEFCFPHDRHDLVAFVHRQGTMINTSYENSGIRCAAEVTEKTMKKLEDYLVQRN